MNNQTPQECANDSSADLDDLDAVDYERELLHCEGRMAFIQFLWGYLPFALVLVTLFYLLQAWIRNTPLWVEVDSAPTSRRRQNAKSSGANKQSPARVKRINAARVDKAISAPTTGCDEADVADAGTNADSDANDVPTCRSPLFYM